MSDLPNVVINKGSCMNDLSETINSVAIKDNLTDDAEEPVVNEGIFRQNLQILASFNSPELSDAMDSLHIETVLLGIQPLLPNRKIIGPIFTVKYKLYHEQPDDFKSAGDYIDNVPAGSVILVDNEGREDCTTWGGILTQVALQKGMAGTVIYGACRDVDVIRALGYPVFTKATTMRSGKNRVYKAAEQIDVQIGAVIIKPGDILFGDDCGVLVIPQQHLSTVIGRAKNIAQTEAGIIEAIQTGMSLTSARQWHRYDQPWLSHAEKSNRKS